MKILITGATGYIGHKLAMEAAKRNFTVHALVRDPHSKNFPAHPNIIPFKGDITDKDSIIVAMQGCEKVMHAAGLLLSCIVVMWSQIKTELSITRGCSMNGILLLIVQQIPACFTGFQED
jgi:putative NADH-flavin reductase